MTDRGRAVGQPRARSDTWPCATSPWLRIAPSGPISPRRSDRVLPSRVRLSALLIRGPSSPWHGALSSAARWVFGSNPAPTSAPSGRAQTCRSSVCGRGHRRRPLVHHKCAQWPCGTTLPAQLCPTEVDADVWRVVSWPGSTDRATVW